MPVGAFAISDSSSKPAKIGEASANGPVRTTRRRSRQNQRPAMLMSTFQRYLLFQVPGWVLGAIILFAFRDHVLLVVESWEKMPSHAHGYVVVLVVAYFLWKKRPFVDTVPFSPSSTQSSLARRARVATYDRS